jgi:hypothetical protein
VPVAVNCWVVPLAMEGLTGVTAIDTSVGGVTVSVSAGLTILASVAVMLLVPWLILVAKPVAAMVATEGFEEAQVTLDVMFCVLPSP